MKKLLQFKLLALVVLMAVCNAGSAWAQTTISSRQVVDEGGSATLTSNATYTVGSSSESGGAILNYGTVAGSNVTFSGCSAQEVGGAFCNADATSTLTNATFNNNTVTSTTEKTFGGAFANAGYDASSNATFSGTTSFSGNSGNFGGAIHNQGKATTTFKGKVTFENNKATSSSVDTYGGAIYNLGASVVFEDDATFTGNESANGDGGVIANLKQSSSGLCGNIHFKGKATFKNNKAWSPSTAVSTSIYGGAILNKYATLVFEKDALFEGNTADYSGGAIQATGVAANKDTITFNGKADFKSNKGKIGGAIRLQYYTIMTFNDVTTFTGNSVLGSGGAIYIDAPTSVLNLNGKTIFSGNTASSHSGAMYVDGNVFMRDTVVLETKTDSVYLSFGTLCWDFSTGKSPLLQNFQYVKSNKGKLLINLKPNMQLGDSLIVATGDFSDVTGKDEFTLTGIGEQTAQIVIGTPAKYGNSSYLLYVNDNGTPADKTDDKLVLEVVACSIDLSTKAGWFTTKPAAVEGTFIASKGVASFKVNGSTDGLTYDNSKGTWKYSYNGADVKDSLLTIILKDASGLADTATYTLKVDTVAPKFNPVKNVFLNGTTHAGELNKFIARPENKVTISIGYHDDATSGVDKTSFTFSPQPANQQANAITAYTVGKSHGDTINYTVKFKDYAGNWSQVQPFCILVDGEGPVINSLAFAGQDYTDPSTGKAWYKQGNQNAKIVGSFSDAPAGYSNSFFGKKSTASTFTDEYVIDASAEIFEIKNVVTAVDSLGYQTKSDSLAYGIDGTAPAIKTNEGGKHISATDGGSGLKLIEYSFDNQAWVTYDETKIDDLIAGDNIYVRATDNVGNVSDILALYTIDHKNLVTVEGDTVIYALLTPETNTPIFNETMEKVDKNLFRDNKTITNLEIPSNIKKICDSAFKGCDNLGTIMCFGTEIPDVESDAFSNIAPGALLFVLPHLEKDYEASAWSNFFDNDHILPMTPPNNELWYLTTDGKAIDMTQAKQAFDTEIDEAETKYEGYGKIKFVSEVDRIARFAFKGNETLRMFFTPKSIDNIQPYTFQNCKNLEVVCLTDSLEKINENAFEGCESLRLLYLPTDTKLLKEIDAFAFRNCKGLETLTLPASIEYIGSRSFWGCEGIKSITLLGTTPENVNMTQASFEGLSDNTPIFVPSDKLLQYEAYNYGKGINFQTKVTKTLYHTRGCIFCHHNMIVPAGVQVYGSKWNGSKYVRTEAIVEGEILEGGKGYLVEDGLKSGTRNFVFVTTSEEATAGFDSELSGSIETVYVGDLLKFGRVFMVLAAGSDFYELDQQYATAGFAGYLAFGLVEPQSGTPVKYFDFENWYNGWVTGVQTSSEVRSEELGVRSYNLAGQAVGSDYKGIVIKNGKKYLNR